MHPAKWDKEDYAKLTDKVYQGLLETSDLPLFDWYLLADDDTFVHIRNLLKFLSQKISNEPVQYGHHFKAKVFIFF